MWFSIWADTSVELGNKLKKDWVKVDLLITVDLHGKNNTTVLEDNILRAVNYHQTNWILDTNISDWVIKWATELERKKWNTITDISNITVNTRCSIYECKDTDKDTPFFNCYYLSKIEDKNWFILAYKYNSEYNKEKYKSDYFIFKLCNQW